jgi:hypothetical protein
MADEHSILLKISEHWPALSGICAFLAVAGYGIKKRIQDPTVRTSQLKQSCAEAHAMIDEHEEREIERAQEYRDENMKAHSAISTKVDNLTTLFIKHIDKH